MQAMLDGVTTVTGGYIYGFKPVNDALKSVIDRFKPVNVAPCDRSAYHIDLTLQ